VTRLRKIGGDVSTGVESPCIDVCRMDGELCVGCYRTLDEIVRWSTASDDDKREILTAVAQRRADLAPGSQSIAIA
jgi:predicted Fe-S protein YdhL (DUF1289 family)